MIRLSGSRVRAALDLLAGGVPEPRAAVLRKLYHPDSKEEIDSGLILFFSDPRSFTGEDLAEFHVHGSNAVIKQLLQALSGLTGFRLAEPGEFSRRALLNGKMDLSQAEGLADLIHAETAFQRRNALATSSGKLGQVVSWLRSEMLELLALIEAQIDFSDEGDVTGPLEAQVLERGSRVLGRIERLAGTAVAGERLREGWRVVIAGPANSGKSALFNALCGREAAIVSPFAGTTRDVNTAYLDVGGYPVILMDVAGFRETDDPVEAIGIDRAEKELERADFILWANAADQAEVSPVHGDARVLRILTKGDLGQPRGKGRQPVITSAVGAPGIDALVEAILERISSTAPGDEPILIAHERQRRALADSAEAIRTLPISLSRGLEFAAADLRRAVRSLERLTGAIDVEDVLGVIFSRFCIGK